MLNLTAAKKMWQKTERQYNYAGVMVTHHNWIKNIFKKRVIEG